MQYHGGALRISEWAHFVNASVLAGEGIVEALSQTAASKEFEFTEDRALLILAEMTTKGSLATGEYTKASVEVARKYKSLVVGFVATRKLVDVSTDTKASDDEDFVVFSTGINRASKGDSLGQQYQTPAGAIARGVNFIISGRGIYGAKDPIEAVQLYRKEGWEAYLERINGGTT